MSGLESTYEDRVESFRTNCVAFAGFSLLLWDHMLTFPAEVEYIWHGVKGPCESFCSSLGIDGAYNRHLSIPSGQWMPVLPVHPTYVIRIS
ncbi:hypothetical protein FB45DRAFT_221892 [Roridomyces roridus]|uniref:DUF6533 domain-containing protein n=1 Tax=Roridomyces roridus TaxID=1738132 RepID=A0AAD7AX15_9AGAR|nr:hypothetical protein FB45DRAFT_221892 [Roridomyces roridus]